MDCAERLWTESCPNQYPNSLRFIKRLDGEQKNKERFITKVLDYGRTVIFILQNSNKVQSCIMKEMSSGINKLCLRANDAMGNENEGSAQCDVDEGMGTLEVNVEICNLSHHLLRSRIHFDSRELIKFSLLFYRLS